MSLANLCSIVSVEVYPKLRVERIETARMLSAAEFEGLFGSAPDFTGDLSTDEWIDSIRSDEWIDSIRSDD
jgi:hypothetical protein